MLSKILRLAVFSALLAYGIYLIIESFIGNGILMIFLSFIVFFTYFRNEMLLMAFWYLRKQNFEKAGKFLSYIKSPDTSLINSQRAYYYYLTGLIESQKQTGKALGDAEKAFKNALTIGLNMDHDKAMANLQMAAIVMSKGRKTEAQNYLAQAKKLDKSKILTDQIKMIQSQLKLPFQKNMDHFRMGGGAKMRKK